MNSPLHLEQYALVAVALQTAAGEAISEKFQVTANPQVAQNDTDPLDWIIRLDVDIANPSADLHAPYTGRLEFFGKFRLAAEIPEDRRLLMVSNHGASILYGAVREMVANLTARMPHGMITLPAMSFIPRTEELPPRRSKAPAKNLATRRR